MTNEQLNDVEHNLGLDSTQQKGFEPFRVEIFLKGHDIALTGDYERRHHSDLVLLRRGISVHWIDIDSIAAIGVINT